MQVFVTCLWCDAARWDKRSVSLPQLLWSSVGPVLTAGSQATSDDEGSHGWAPPPASLGLGIPKGGLRFPIFWSYSLVGFSPTGTFQQEKGS